MRSYANNSVHAGVGENWMDEAYDNNWFSGDDCPTSIIFGPTTEARHSMYSLGGWLDRRSHLTKSGSTIFYISGCDPDNGSALP